MNAQTNLTTNGITTPSVTISKDKINFEVGAMILPFSEMAGVTTGSDMDTINHLTDILVFI